MDIQYKDLPKVNSQEWLTLNTFTGERWEQIPGFEGYYEISNYGRVKSIARYVEYSKGTTTCTLFVPTKILKQTISKKGYYRVSLLKKEEHKKIAVHIIVARTFLENPNDYPQINHKDENKKNNTVFFKSNGEIDHIKSNLEWCTAKYNANYGTKNERISIKLKETYSKKKCNHNPKKVSQSDLKGVLITSFPSIYKASKQTGIDPAGIARCCKGEYSKFKGYIWRFL